MIVRERPPTVLQVLFVCGAVVRIFSSASRLPVPCFILVLVSKGHTWFWFYSQYTHWTPFAKC